MHAFFKYMNAGGAPRRPQTELPVKRNSLSFQMPAHLAQKTAELSPFGKHAEQRPPEQIALGAAFFRPVPFAVKNRAAEYAPKIFGIPFRGVVFPAGAGRHLLAAHIPQYLPEPAKTRPTTICARTRGKRRAGAKGLPLRRAAMPHRERKRAPLRQSAPIRSSNRRRSRQSCPYPLPKRRYPKKRRKFFVRKKAPPTEAQPRQRVRNGRPPAETAEELPPRAAAAACFPHFQIPPYGNGGFLRRPAFAGA